MTSSVALYIIGYLADQGEHGWVEAESRQPGAVVLLVKGDERIEYGHRFNGMWYCCDAPGRVRELLPEPFRSAGGSNG